MENIDPPSLRYGEASRTIFRQDHLGDRISQNDSGEITQDYFVRTIPDKTICGKDNLYHPRHAHSETGEGLGLERDSFHGEGVYIPGVDPADRSA